MGVFDEAEHEGIELNPAGFHAWLLEGLDPDLAFRGWLETQSPATTHQREKRADLVAEFRSKSGVQPPWACLVEAQAQPYPDMLLRVLEHLARLGQQLRHGPHRQDRFLMMAGIVNLTETRQADTLELLPPMQVKEGKPRGMVWRIWVRDVLFESAPETLKGIEEGRIARCVLVWTSMMLGADDPAVIAEWKRLASLEPDPIVRATYGALALTFSERVSRKEVWEKELEGWNVDESYFVNKWQAEGFQRAIKKVLIRRGVDPIPPTLLATLESQKNVDVLSEWMFVADKVSSADEFLTAIKSNGSP